MTFTDQPKVSTTLSRYVAADHLRPAKLAMHQSGGVLFEESARIASKTGEFNGA